MSQKRNTVLPWFKRYLKPTEIQFKTLFNSIWFKDEMIPGSSIAGLNDLLNKKAAISIVDGIQEELDGVQKEVDGLEKYEAGDNIAFVKNGSKTKINGIVDSIDPQAGTNIVIDKVNPLKPVINSVGYCVKTKYGLHLTPKDAILTLDDIVFGAIKISLPQSWSESMISFNVEIYANLAKREGLANPPSNITISGYTLLGGWVNTSVKTNASNKDSDFKVRFGHDGKNCCVYIGDLDSKWFYLNVRVKDVFVALNNYAYSSWEKGWNLDLEQKSFQNVDIESTNNFPIAKDVAIHKLHTTKDINTNNLLQGLTQNGRHVVLRSDRRNLRVIIDSDNFTATYYKTGRGSIIFYSKMELIEVDGTNQLKGKPGSTATVLVDNGKVYLRISNV